jgi:hypothetical protein
MTPETNTFKAIVRGLMPFIISGAGAAIAHFGYTVSNSTVIQIVAIAGAALTIILHAAETQWPWVGVFLGYIGAPVYAQSTKISQKAEIAALEAKVAALVAAQEEAKNPSTPTVA